MVGLRVGSGWTPELGRIQLGGEVRPRRLFEAATGAYGIRRGRLARVKTSVLERMLDEWPSGEERWAQLKHSATIWLSDNGMSVSRVSPAPGD